MNKTLLFYVAFFSYFLLFSQETNFVQEDFIKLDYPEHRGEGFGSSSAYDNGILVIGAPDHFGGGIGTRGAAYVFERIGNKWINTAKLEGPEDDLHDKFGMSVAVHDGTIAVGSPWDDENGSSSGSVFVYDKVGQEWNRTEKLIPADNSGADFFGQSVSIFNDTIVIGAPSDDDIGKNSGSVYFYERTNGVWSESDKLTASDGKEDMKFGHSVDLEGNILVVGDALSAYIFELENQDWTEKRKFQFSVGPLSSHSERIVRISQNTIAVGGFWPVVVIEKEGDDWNAPIEVTGNDVVSTDDFGISLDLKNDMLVVGAIRSNFQGNDAGSAYVFTKNSGNWEEKKTLLPNHASDYDHFGSTVVITEDAIIVGAEGEDSPNGESPDVDQIITLNSGAAYSFMIDSDADGVVDLVEIEDGTNQNDNCDFVWENQNAVPGDEWMVLDCDEDGLTNSAEYNQNTNSNNSDTDGDGVDDLADIGEALDPCLPIQDSQYQGYDATNSIWADADCDGDTVLNGNEVVNGTNPYEYESNISIDLTIQPITCFSFNDASIEVFVTGGSMPYTYELLDSNEAILLDGNNNLFSDLPPGEYMVRATDSLNHSISSSIISIADPTPLTATSNIEGILCHNSGDGRIEVLATGGTPPYNYSLNNGQPTSSNLFANLQGGVYEIKIIDANGCEFITTAELQEASPIQVDVIHSDVSCLGARDGSITINASEGVSPYLFSLSDASSASEENVFSNLTMGTYEVSTIDSAGCIIVTQVEIGLLDNADFDNDGLGDECDEDTDGDGVLNVQDTCPNTPLGVSVDFSGCEIIDIPSDNFTIQIKGESCEESNDGAISLVATANYSYSAILIGNGQDETKTFDNNVVFGDLDSGNYEVCITITEKPDYEQCYSLQLIEPEGLTVSYAVDASGEKVTLNLNGGSNYEVQVNEELYETSENQIEVSISKGVNKILVRTDVDCQGIFEETILGSDKVRIFPVPVENEDLTIVLNNTVEGLVQLSLYNSQGKLVKSELQEINNSSVQINIGLLPSGLYNLKIATSQQIYSRRILKK